MRNPKHGAVRILRIKPTDDLKAIYAKVKRSFTAADLQKFTETEEGVPADHEDREPPGHRRDAGKVPATRTREREPAVLRGRRGDDREGGGDDIDPRGAGNLGLRGRPDRDPAALSGSDLTRGP